MIPGHFFQVIFENKGYEVNILTLRENNLEHIKIFKVKSKTYEKRRNNLEYNRLKVFFDVLPQVKSIIKKIKPDVVHAHFACSFGLLGALSGFRPFFLSVWGYDTITFPEQNIINKMLIKFVLSKADKIFSTSKFLAEKTARYTKKEIIITPFGVNTDIFRQYKRDDQNKFIFGTIKTLNPKYGMKYLIKAAKLFDNYQKNWELHIAGLGIEEQELKALARKLEISGKVKFLGNIEHSEVHEHLNKFKVFIVPSVWECESFGVAAVEASACGIPVIASKIGGLPEVIRNNTTGFLVEPKSPQDICDKLLLLYNDSNLRIEMGKNARQFIIDNYKWENNAEIMLDVYRREGYE